MQYQIKRGETIIATVTPEGKQSKKVMDINIVDMTFSLAISVAFSIGDTVDVYGEQYVLQELPTIKKNSSRDFEYTMQFKGRAYELSKIDMFYPDADNNLTEADFPIMGNADTVIDLLIQNANRVQSGWVKGNVDVTFAQNHTFSGTNCLAVLSQLATTYETEWWIDNQTIHFTKKGEVQNITFEYGQGKGLYDITRTTQTDKSIITRLYAYGSSDNIPGSYRSYSKRLKLPAPNIYLEANTDIYGIIESVQFFEDVKPEYKGTITSVIDTFNFIDTGIDFDLNVQQLPTVKPKVTFITGQLAGYNFEIGGYDPGTKKVRILKNQNEKSIDLPSDLLHPEVGDTFSFIDLNMPVIYITDAENRLAVKGQDFLDKNNRPWVIYSVTCDPINLKQRAITINLGDYYKMIDTDFTLNDNQRLNAFTRNLQIPSDYTFDLSDTMTIAQIVRNYNTYQGIKSAVAINKLSDINRARMNWKTTQELRNMVYDPDGDYFDPGNIKPLSIETAMLSVGAKAQQFLLSGVTISANYEGDASQFSYTAGQLTHFTLFDTPATWNISGGLITGLAAPTAYYIYVKCSKSTDDATIELSTTPVKTEEVPGYYMFWLGTLSSVIDGVRGDALTYGQTTINGRFIKTGNISSFDGLTFFDLDAGIIGGRIQFGTDGGSTIVDGKLLTSSTIILGDPDTGDQWASFTGDVNYLSPGVVDPSSIVLSIGTPFADRADAPLNALVDGTFICKKGVFVGSKIGNFIIDENGLTNDENIDAYIMQQKKVSGSIVFEASIGTNIGQLYGGVGVFQNLKDDGNPNAGVKISVKNGVWAAPLLPNFSGNLGLDLEGDLWFRGGNMVIGGGGDYKGQSVIIVYKGASGDNYFMEFVDGWMVRYGEGTGD